MKTHIRALVLGAFVALSSAAAYAGSISAPALSSSLGEENAPLVLDVRSEREYRSGHVPGAVHIPYDQLADRLSELPGGRDQEIVVYCEVGGRASVAEDVLKGAGFTEVLQLQGHMRHWRAEGFPREK